MTTHNLTASQVRQLNTIGNLWYYFARNRGGVRWSIERGEYVWNSNGRTVSPAKIQAELFQLVEQYHQNIDRLAARLSSGNLSIVQWQERMRREIKDLHRTQFVIGRGGVDQMGPSDWGKLGADLRWKQYAHLDGFAIDIAEGKRLKDGTYRPYTDAEIRKRARMYADASNKQFWHGKTRAMITAGYVSEQRCLGQAAHCDVCVGFANMGRGPIGTLPNPGEECQGIVHCKCKKKYYKEGE